MNKDRYKSELNNIKPDERLVRNTINLIKEREMEPKKSIFTFQKLAIGVCSLVIIGSIGYTSYNYNTYNKETNASKENSKYASSTVYKIEEENSNITSNIQELEKKESIRIDGGNGFIPSVTVGLNKLDESSFRGMYLIRKTDNSTWKLYKHTKEYKYYKELIEQIDSLATQNKKVSKVSTKNTYENSYLKIYSNKGTAKISKDTMLVKVGYNYLIYVPSKVDNPITVQLLGTEGIVVYNFNIEKTKQQELDKLRNFISTTGTEIVEEKQEEVDRNIKVTINGVEDKTRYAEKAYFIEETSDLKAKYTYENKLIVTLKDNYKDITNPQVEFNKEKEINVLRNKVDKMLVSYVGQEAHAYIIVLGKDGTVYRIKTSEWVKEGFCNAKPILSNAEDIYEGTNSQGYVGVFATVNGEKVELNLD